MGYDAEKFKARANTKAGNIWLILNILLTMQYLSNMTKGTYDQKFIIPFLIIGWVPYIIGVIYTKIKGKSADGYKHILGIWFVLWIYSMYKHITAHICIYISSSKYDYSVQGQKVHSELWNW